MRVVRTHQSSFERQVYEGIRIQNERGKHDILNSKTEYNRCALPRLVVKVGDGKDKGKDKERREEEIKEAEIERKINEMMKNRRNIVKRKGKNEPEGDKDSSKKEKDMRDDKINVKRNKAERKREDLPTKGENKITQYVTVSEIKKGGKETMMKKGGKEKSVGDKTPHWRTIGKWPL